MAELKFEVIQDLTSFSKDLRDKLNKELPKAIKGLARATLAHLKDMAGSDLKSRRELYISSLTMEEASKNTWIVSLDPKADWIEEGMEPHNMISDLVKNGKTAKDGSKYQVIPFKHNAKPQARTNLQQTMIREIKTELRKQKIPFAAIEKDESGSPKIGLLHKIKMPPQNPMAKSDIDPHGKSRAGHKKGAIEDFKGPSGRPYLSGMAIYQREYTNKKGGTSVRKDIMTFRTASTKQMGKGLWDHPGTEGMKFFDEAADFADQKWKTEILPEILNKLKG